jgi:hypothetical protein
MNELSIEYIYEIIVNWDEGGGKRSRRELARRIHSELYSPSAQPGWCTGCTPENCPGCGEAALPVPMLEAEAKPADERAAFEAWYAEDAKQQTGIDYTAEGIAALRCGEHYLSPRVELHAKWEGWQARAALEVEAKPAEPDNDSLQELLCNKSFESLWMGYLDKKAEVEDLREELAKIKAAPAAPAPLTDEQIDLLFSANKKALCAIAGGVDQVPTYRRHLVRMVERAHGITKGGAA